LSADSWPVTTVPVALVSATVLIVPLATLVAMIPLGLAADVPAAGWLVTVAGWSTGRAGWAWIA